MTDKETRKKAVDWIKKRIKEGKPVWTPKKKTKMEAYTAKKKAQGREKIIGGLTSGSSKIVDTARDAFKSLKTKKPAKIDNKLFWANRKKKAYPKIGKDY